MTKMHQIWKFLRDTGHYEGITIAKEIRDSWARSAAVWSRPV